MRTVEQVEEWAQRFLVSGDNLPRQVLRGGLWMLALRVLSQIALLIRTVILARILSPEDFGLMGIALLAVSTMETFSETGLGKALIQRSGSIEEYLDTAWTISAVRGLVLFSIIFLAAPHIALLLGSPMATSVLRIIGICLFLRGLTSIGVVYFQKELDFNKQFLYRLGGTVADLTIAIMAALLLQSVWALVLGLLAGDTARLMLSYMLHPYRPGVRFDRRKAKELYGFGRWVFSNSILGFLITQGDDFLVGKTLGTAALGYYQMAYGISNLPATEITHTVSQVTFPAYAKIQKRTESVRKAYSRVLRTTTLLTLPLGMVIALVARDLVSTLLGEKWLPMVPALQVLCVFGVLRSVNATLGPLYHAMGRPEILTRVSAFQLLFLVCIIYPLTTHYGILGTSIAVTLSNGICFLLASWEGARLIQGRVLDFLGDMRLGLILALGVGVLLLTIQWLTPVHWGELGRLIMEMLVLIPITSFFGIHFMRAEISTRRNI